MDFIEFPKMARFKRDIIISEKIDGTNACVFIRELPDDEVMPTDTPLTAVHGNLLLYAGSRTQWITPAHDNFGFAAWVRDNSADLAALGAGQHFGEWWGSGIQRNYGLKEKRFSLFNTVRWTEHGTEPQPIASANPKAEPRMQQVAPACCRLTPVLYCGVMDTVQVELALLRLKTEGSKAAPGFMKPEGIVVFHVAGNVGFKQTIDRDGMPKGALA